MVTTITGTYTLGVALYSSYLPAIFTSTARVSRSYIYSGGYPGRGAGVAVHAFGTVTNAGHIKSYEGSGIDLLFGGAVTNQSGGYIDGYLPAITFAEYSGSASVVNQAGGTLKSTEFYGVAFDHVKGSITNAGIITARDQGIRFDNGGSVNNSGLISGAGGVNALTASATVVNSGTIKGTYFSGIGLYAGGAVTNLASGLIEGIGGGTYAGDGIYVHDIYISAGSIVRGTYIDSTVTNFGTIEGVGTHSNGVYLRGGGTVTNGGGGKIEGSVGVQGGVNALAVYNSGYIYGTGVKTKFTTLAGTGVQLNAGGIVTNTGNVAEIKGGWGVFITGGPGTVINTGGEIFATAFEAVYLGGGGTVINNGTTADLTGSGAINYGVEIAGGSGTITNQGGIGGANTGIYLKSGGLITNEAGANIIGDVTGIRMPGPGTVVNYGSIFGYGSGTAIALGTGDELALGVGSFLHGEAAGTASTLALLPSGYPYGVVSGIGSGTLTGSINDTLSGFTSYLIKPAAYWTFDGTNSVNVGDTLLDQGILVVGLGSTLLNNGVIRVQNFMDVTGTLTNDATVTVPTSGLLNTTTLGGTGTVDVAGGKVQLLGPSNGATLDFKGAGQIVVSSTFTTGVTIRDFTSGDTISLGVPFSASNSVAYNAGLHQIILYGPTHATLGAIGASNVTIAPGMELAQVNGSQTDIVEIACFAAGTRIATERGEVPVEMLRIGDLVHSPLPSPTLLEKGEGRVRNEVIWLGHRHIDCTRHPSPQKVWPVRIITGAFGNGLPRRDLWLSPDHAVQCNDVLIPIRHLINGATIVQVPVDAIHYFHVELPQHDILLAEGLPVESYLDTGDRASFANGGAHIALHPDFATCTREARSCLPLVVTGPSLAVARRSLAEPRTAHELVTKGCGIGSRAHG